VQTCGDFDYSHVASRAALYLLCRLLDVEKNKDAQLFLDEFVNLDVPVLKKMNLHTHIASERGNRLGAFRIVSILRDHGIKTNNPELSVESIVADMFARQEYNKWSDRKTAQVTTHQHVPQEKIKSPLTEAGHKSVAANACKELQKVAQNQSGWRQISQVGGMTEEDDKKLPASGADERVTITYYTTHKEDSYKDIVVVKVTTVIRSGVDKVAALLRDLKRQKEWDLKFHKGRQLAKLDQTSDVAHMVYKSWSSPYKYRDFILLRSCTSLENGVQVLVAKSISHPLGPEFKGNLRAVLLPTGFVLTPLERQTPFPLCPMQEKCVLKDASHLSRYSHHPGLHEETDRCLLTFVAQMDREGVLILSPDLLGETTELRDSIGNIKECLRQDAVKAHKAKQSPKP